MRVRLESQDDAASVASSLAGAVREVLEARRRAGVTDERIEALSGVLTKMAGSIMDKMEENIRVGEYLTIDEEEEEEEEEDLWRDNKENAGEQMYHRDKSAGKATCKDEELVQLEKDVTELVTKIQDYRTRVPKIVEEKIQNELSALRPEVRQRERKP